MQVTECEIRVRSTDMDADGIVNNARYFEYFEQARLEHLIALEIVVRPRPPEARRRQASAGGTGCRRPRGSGTHAGMHRSPAANAHSTAVRASELWSRTAACHESR